jgi:hypothetical protein
MMAEKKRYFIGVMEDSEETKDARAEAFIKIRARRKIGRQNFVKRKSRAIVLISEVTL